MLALLAKMFNFDNTYINLPESFYQKLEPTKVKQASLIQYNTNLANELNLPDLDSQNIAEIFSGNKILEGGAYIAQAYAGHQFGHFVPQLGDGRAIMMGELLDKDGNRKDIQLKGSGPTSFSRAGDGRAWLGPVIREYIVSEAMHALGLPTTRSLAAVSTGENIYRETELPGAILTRVASSHIRIGTFEYFAARKDFDALRILADYVIDRHYPKIKNSDNPYQALLEIVAKRQAALVVKWMSIGFIHGVMNTDNMSIAGETIDYGPCAFMDFYDPAKVFSSIDRHGRYAYQNQGAIAQWNLTSFANTLLPLMASDQEKSIAACTEILKSFKFDFDTKLESELLKKIGIEKQSSKDFQLVQDLLDLMAKYQADFSLSFRYLSELVDKDSDSSKFLQLFDNHEKSGTELDLWLQKWRSRIKEESRDFDLIAKAMNDLNPAFIARNHRVEEAISAAQHNSDYSLMEKLLKILSKPYKDQDDFVEYSLPPETKTQDYQTFCGT